MARDVFDLMLNTLIINLSDVTEIPSGHFWVNYPNKNFLNGETYNKFPSVGIVELEFFNLRNNYGTIQILPTETSGVYTEYRPAGEIKVVFRIEVYTKEPFQRRSYRTLLNHFFQQNKQLEIEDDILSNQCFSIYPVEGYQSEDAPYVLYYIIECVIQDFKEEEVYIVNEVEVNTQAGQNITVGGDLNTSFTNTFTASSGSIEYG